VDEREPRNVIPFEAVLEGAEIGAGSLLFTAHRQ
jgi:hypothetical protein